MNRIEPILKSSFYLDKVLDKICRRKVGYTNNVVKTKTMNVPIHNVLMGC